MQNLLCGAAVQTKNPCSAILAAPLEMRGEEFPCLETQAVVIYSKEVRVGLRSIDRDGRNFCSSKQIGDPECPFLRAPQQDHDVYQPARELGNQGRVSIRVRNESKAGHADACGVGGLGQGTPHRVIQARA